MDFDQCVKELLALMLKMMSAEYSDRRRTYNEAKEVIKRIQKEHDKTAEALNDVAKRAVKAAVEAKNAKQELAFFKIAAGELVEEELNATVDCMKKAVMYYCKEKNYE